MFNRFVDGCFIKGFMQHDRPAPPGLLARERLFILGVATAAVLFLILATLGAATDWWRVDEAFTWDMVRDHWGAMIRRTMADVHPPLYYLALKGFCQLWSRPEAMQAFSMLMGLGALLTAALIGRLLRGARLGVLVALLWATFPFLLHYSQDARMYTMALFLETLGLLGWAMAPRRPRAGWALFVLSLTASLYTQNLCLIFAAALIAGETARHLFLWCKKTYSTPPPRILPKPGLRWILSAAITIALSYAPWTWILHHQMNNPGLKLYIRPPLWVDVAKGLFLYPYTLFNFPSLPLWTWAPGLVFIAVLPALWLRARLRRAVEVDKTIGAPPVCEILIGVVWLCLVFAVLYSKLILPIFEICRHAMLFTPFLLIPAAAWLEERSLRWTGRLAVIGLVALSGALCLATLRHPRERDMRPQIDAILTQAPSGPPILAYPRIIPTESLMWEPVKDYGERTPIPGDVTSCTLIVRTREGFQREAIMRAAKLTMTQAASVKPIFSTYEASAYLLKGLPPGALAKLVGRNLGIGVDSIDRQAGRWLPEVKWAATELAGALEPAGQLAPMTLDNPYWLGLRLNHPQSDLVLSMPEKAGESYGAVMAGGYLISGNGENSFRTRLGRGLEYLTEPVERGFMFARLAAGGMGKSRIHFSIPESVVRPRTASLGSLLPGFYLNWAGWRPLRRAEFQKPGYAGEVYDAGALGDELYLRSGFNEPEGTPSAETRWTRATFEAELPVWPGSAPREVVLWGALNANIRERRIALEVTPNAGGPPVRAEATFPQSDFGPYALRFPAPLAPGIYRFRFTVGTWSPKAAGLGGDARELGFFLDALQLRE